jgi:hypothetical protein
MVLPFLLVRPGRALLPGGVGPPLQARSGELLAGRQGYPSTSEVESDFGGQVLYCAW